jgi:hypothetical protein
MKIIRSFRKSSYYVIGDLKDQDDLIQPLYTNCSVSIEIEWRQAYQPKSSPVV